MRLPGRQTAGYLVVLAVCFLVAMIAAWTDPGAQIDNDVYDFMVRHSPAHDAPSDSIILAVDERTLLTMGGMRDIRATIADNGGAIHSIDEVVAGKIIIDDASTPQDPYQG